MSAAREGEHEGRLRGKAPGRGRADDRQEFGEPVQRLLVGGVVHGVERIASASAPARVKRA